MTREIRTFNGAEYRIEQDENGKKHIEGYAFKFNRDSRDMGFIETIDKRAISENTDMTDVVALFNHNPNFILARKNNNVDTLQITVDETGLKYRFEVDTEISYIKDLQRLIEKGEITESSFAFRIKDGGDKWDKRADGKYIRTILDFEGIYDVSVVTKGAYSDTKVDVRNFTKNLETKPEPGTDNFREYQYKYFSFFRK
jgi:uncharacterized protein